jgi:hypothetical protein
MAKDYVAVYRSLLQRSATSEPRYDAAAEVRYRKKAEWPRSSQTIQCAALPKWTVESDFWRRSVRKLGFIEYNGKLQVHSSLLNVVLYDQPAIKTGHVEI